MTDKWRTLPQHYCEVCNNWFEKSSEAIKRHENSSRHKAAAAKNASRERKKKMDADQQKKMYAHQIKEIEQRANVSMAAGKSNKAAALTNWALATRSQGVDTGLAKRQIEVQIMRSMRERQEEQKKKAEEGGQQWYEYYSPEGYKYWYNVLTQESSWEDPTISTTAQVEEREGEGKTDNSNQPTKKFTKRQWNLLTDAEREQYAQWSPYAVEKPPEEENATTDTTDITEENKDKEEEVEQQEQEPGAGIYAAWSTVPVEEEVFKSADEDEEGEEGEEEGSSEPASESEGDSETELSKVWVKEVKADDIPIPSKQEIPQESEQPLTDPVKFNKRPINDTGKKRNFRRKT